ncbi:MAG: hypothetical protein Q9178_002962 [Gyalolechia marmorata]
MASTSQMMLMLRKAAPRLTRSLFMCHHACKSPPTSQQSQRLFGTSVTRLSNDGLIPGPQVAAQIANISRSLQSSKKKASFFPELSDKSAAYWLLGSAASVFGIVVFGGLTRLTESGLSITEWRPVTGSLPPRNDQDWTAEFTKYRSSPEFKLLNPHMTLDEFKSIYYMEWGHRIWGRVVGISFLLPAAYFIVRRKVSAPMAAKIVGIAGLIGFQGFLGWWMVKSGLKDDLFAPGSHPRVSQYRLTAHLGTAFLCYTAMLWNGLSILREHKLLADPQAAMKLFERLKRPELRFFRASVGALAGLVFCTAMSGGLVAGLDAGLIYNEFPYMGSGLTPPKSELFSDFYSHTPDKSDIWWRNALENPSLVQLDHRILATTTFTSVMALWAYTKFSPTLGTMLPAACKRGMHGVVGFVGLQVALGITTLLYLVPLPLASAHQAGSLALLSSVIILGGRTWVPRRATKLVSQSLAKPVPTPTRPRMWNQALDQRLGKHISPVS